LECLQEACDPHLECDLGIAGVSRRPGVVEVDVLRPATTIEEQPEVGSSLYDASRWWQAWSGAPVRKHEYSIILSMTRKTFSRIAITLPARDLAAADRLAKKQDRSRSWIVAEAVRRYVAFLMEESGEPEAANAGDPAIVDAPRAGPMAGGSWRPVLGDSRLHQLRRDMALTPEERVRAAEETVRLSELRAGPRPRQLLQFDRFEDYLEWKRREFA
jgi:hypothetical protein